MDFKALISQLVALFGRLNRNQQIVIVATVVAIVGFIVFMILYNAKPAGKEGYKVLFDRLTPADAAIVVEQLKKDKIDYELLNETTIAVPEAEVYKERIAIASLGIIKDNKVGFELFDKQEFGATSFDQDIKYKRALEGELARTIAGLRPIKEAIVHLALPKETLFVAKQEEPTASVQVTFEESMRLTRQQIVGIKNLVSAAVPKLHPEKVSLIDADGVPLGDGDEFEQSSERAKLQTRYETRQEEALEQKIVKVLAPIIGGDDRVRAQVNIEFDFSQREMTQEKFDPENVVRSEQIIEEKREGSRPKEIGGVPGAVSNIGPVEGLQGNETIEKYSKNEASTNYDVSKTVTQVKSEFATIKRITAAVLVDGKYEPKKDEEGNPTEEFDYIALDQASLDQINNLVKRTIGYNEARLDDVTVSNFAFRAPAGSIPSATGYTAFMQKVEKYVGPLAPALKYLFVAIILFIFYKKIIVPFADRMLEIQESQEELSRPILSIDEDEGEDLVGKVQAMRKKVEEQLGVNENFNEDALKYDVLLEKLKAMVESKPEDVANLLKVLIEEESIAIAELELGKRGSKP
ncbi:MAG: flagellar M-ring protein FliF [Sulfuricurvum sp. PC08-66]|nr:MAG: flagellar M-ring protein FliF [Sulfuricurvum sp. PC08-66]